LELRPHVLEFAQRVRGHWSQGNNRGAKVLHPISKLRQLHLDQALQ
jgi:hypothetical protein